MRLSVLTLFIAASCCSLFQYFRLIHVEMDSFASKRHSRIWGSGQRYHDPKSKPENSIPTL